jgi:hypothetical protein
MNAPIGQFSRWKEGWKRVLVVVNGFQEVQAPAVDDSTCPRHKKIQLYEIYVRWTSKLNLLSLLTASSNRGSTPCIMKICINRCKHVEDFFVLQGIFFSSTQFCKRDYRTPARVYNVIGLHGSC